MRSNNLHETSCGVFVRCELHSVEVISQNTLFYMYVIREHWNRFLYEICRVELEQQPFCSSYLSWGKSIPLTCWLTSLTWSSMCVCSSSPSPFPGLTFHFNSSQGVCVILVPTPSRWKATGLVTVSLPPCDLQFVLGRSSSFSVSFTLHRTLFLITCSVDFKLQHQTQRHYASKLLNQLLQLCKVKFLWQIPAFLTEP